MPSTYIAIQFSTGRGIDKSGELTNIEHEFKIFISLYDANKAIQKFNACRQIPLLFEIKEVYK